METQNKIQTYTDSSGLPTVNAQDLNAAINDPINAGAKWTLIDVRMRDEYTSELGHIKGAILKTLGPDLVSYLDSLDKNEPIIFICRSGGRSGQATQYCLQSGFKNVINLAGGMMGWNMCGFPIEK